MFLDTRFRGIACSLQMNTGFEGTLLIQEGSMPAMLHLSHKSWTLGPQLALSRDLLDFGGILMIQHSNSQTISF